MADEASTDEEMTASDRLAVTELRQQILANAMYLFPTIVEEYLATHKVREPKPEQVFSIILVKVDGSYSDDYSRARETWAGYDCNDTQQAHLICSPLANRKAVLAARPSGSPYESFLKLLDATERALANLDDGSTWPEEKRMKEAILEGKYMVDLDLLVKSGQRLNGTFRANLTGGHDPPPTA